MPRYYIGVPKFQDLTYGNIRSWKNYSFTGTYEEAAIKAIELFSEEGYFKDYIDKITYFYRLSDKLNDDLMEKARVAWYNNDYKSMWKNTSEYFVDYFKFESYNFNKGITLWDEEYELMEWKRNFDEDAGIVTELESFGNGVDDNHDEDDDDDDDY